MPIRTEASVDLPRFMGSWYVIAHIPTMIETEAYNAIETYSLAEDGSIDTVFTFNEGAFDGEPKRYEPTGYPDAESGDAVWGMQFIWPIKAEYRIVYLDQDYQVTIIGRSKRDYVWIMAREPEVSEAEMADLLALLEAEGYDLSELRMVPQRWEP
jgi:apolipoprotein D and lipocalin family protein